MNGREGVEANVALVISLSNIGDAVMTTPVLEALHRHAPELQMDIVADRRSSAIFEQCPYRRDIHLRDKRAGLRERWALLRALRRTRYRYVVDLRTDGYARLLRADAVYSKRRGRAGLHAVEQHYAVLGPLVGSAAIPATTVWLSDAQRAHARARLGPGGRTLALGPGANWAGKIWPAAGYAALGRELAGEFARVVLLGNAQDRDIAEEVAAALPLPVLNLAGQTDLMEAAAVISAAGAFVGNDSGLGHLAAAVGTPVVTIFGPGEPARYRPWSERSECLIGPGARIDGVTAAAVANAVRTLLARF
jgi:ADP-heptose:LPS heptosyltransferase